ncbi:MULTISPECIES: hypothetical protein [unclassified Pseudomonas]|uniref:hypothetical protein n=1 Tax=unclassified Pseudomonas TaxID=196821 RepID=UPI001A9F3945|nr:MULTISPECIES: hypothetical protein [unclassified Pseudomonas]
MRGESAANDHRRAAASCKLQAASKIKSKSKSCGAFDVACSLMLKLERKAAASCKLQAASKIKSKSKSCGAFDVACSLMLKLERKAAASCKLSSGKQDQKRRSSCSCLYLQLEACNLQLLYRV